MKGRVLTATVLATLALVACGASNPSSTSNPAPATTASSPGAAPEAGNTIAVTISDFKISPSTLTAKAGAVQFDVKNGGPTPHNLTIKDVTGKVLGATKDLKPGETARLVITLTAGGYAAICSLPGHESLGMKGSLTVS